MAFMKVYGWMEEHMDRPTKEKLAIVPDQLTNRLTQRHIVASL